MIAYVTDIEGRWDRLASFCTDNPAISLDGDALVLADGWTFVYGGDVFDRGDDGRRVARALTAARKRYPDRVVLLAGNRDINKIRLPRELSGHPPAGAPDGPDKAELLRWILHRTMGAHETFEHRRAELAASGLDADDDAIVRSYLEDVAPGGAALCYLAECRLAWRIGGTLFVHGGIPEGAWLRMPDGTACAGLDEWIARLNAWYVEHLDRFGADPLAAAPAWWPLVAYQTPTIWVEGPGEARHRIHPTSIVYGRNVRRGNNAVLPEPDVLAGLKHAGIRRLVVGHTPNGDIPSIVRDASGFEMIVADASYPRSAVCPQTFITDDATYVRGRAVLEDGREVAVEGRTPDDAPVGHRLGDGWLVKGRTDTGEWMLFRFAEAYRFEQIARPDL